MICRATIVIGLTLGLVACNAEDKRKVETTTENAADKIRAGANEAKDKAQEVAGDVRDELAPRLADLEVKLKKATEDLANAPTETAKAAARKVVDRIKEEKDALEAQLAK
ncbi:MAG: hypothetical protein H0T89_33990 [Deltaproteobacteria bacterium]|nr:hypothetical protein [Deltaproteobacteria bacterium]MDQ3299180.1 hypothetical protein [Myxococcota bacterium]